MKRAHLAACGSGLGFRLTAIDLGPSMIDAARRRLAGSAVSFEVAPFEDFAAPEASYDLIVSGTAFHWVDPEVRFRKPARLLRPGGWLALLETGDRYDDPLGAALRGMWAARSHDGRVGLRGPHFADLEVIAGTGLFETPVHQAHTQRITRPAETVIGVENTRATSLSWPDDIRREFTEELRHISGPRARSSSPRRPPSRWPALAAGVLEGGQQIGRFYAGIAGREPGLTILGRPRRQGRLLAARVGRPGTAERLGRRREGGHYPRDDGRGMAGTRDGGKGHSPAPRSTRSASFAPTRSRG